MSDFIKVPALGRPFQVGDLYNICTERLVKTNLNFIKTLKLLFSISTDSIDKTNLQVLTPHDVDDVLGLGDGLKLSLLTNLVIISLLEMYSIVILNNLI